MKKSFYWLNGKYWEVEITDKTDWNKVSQGVITAVQAKPGELFNKYSVTSSDSLTKENTLHFKMVRDKDGKLSLEPIDPHDTNL